jgi:putative ABC transport system substrate-binding protein
MKQVWWQHVELSIHQIGSGEEISAAIDAAKASGATVLNVLSSPILCTNRRLIVDRVAAIRMPAIYQSPSRRRCSPRRHRPQLA